MTDTDDIQAERFRAYLDGELAAADAASFEAELAASAELAAAFARYRTTVSLLRTLPPAAPPPHFAERVEGRIRRRSHGRYFALESRLRFPFEAVLCVVLLGVMLSLFMAHSGGEVPVFKTPARGTATPAGPGPAANAGTVGEIALRGATLLPDGRIRLVVPATELLTTRRALAALRDVTVASERALDDGTTEFILGPRGAAPGAE